MLKQYTSKASFFMISIVLTHSTVVYLKHGSRKPWTGPVVCDPPKPSPAPFIVMKVASTPTFFGAANGSSLWLKGTVNA